MTQNNGGNTTPNPGLPPVPPIVPGMPQTSESSQGTQGLPPLPGQPPIPPPPQPRPKREYTKAEKLLLPLSILIGILFDRAYLQYRFWDDEHVSLSSSLFWLGFLVVFCIWQRHKVRSLKALWLVGALTVPLCLWGVFFDYRSSYGTLTAFVIPCVLMAFVVYSYGGFALHNLRALAAEWMIGWFYRPFSAIGHFFGAAAALFSNGKNSNLKKVFLGLLISLPFLFVILPLLTSADMVFAYYLRQVLRNFSLGSLILHLILSALAALLFYSVLWNSRLSKPLVNLENSKEIKLDALVCGIVLGMVLVVYLLFCAVQFTYLFAGAGLPEDMTYSEYAREGFWQLIVVAGFNLVIFGIGLQYVRKKPFITLMLVLLLAITGVMLVSGALRLNLYIDTYGLTWLRLLSAWFTVFLALVLALCAVRLFRPALPLVALCSFVLLAWYTVLGYANPEALIVRYNLANCESGAIWIEDNRYLVRSLSDDGFLVLAQEDLLTDELVRQRLNKWQYAEAYRGYSLANRRAYAVVDNWVFPIEEEEDTGEYKYQANA